MPVLKEDFMRWCDKCNKTGKITVVREHEGWDFKIKKREVKTCPKCKGTKTFFHQGLYVLALEKMVDELETALKIYSGKDEKLFSDIDRRVVKYVVRDRDDDIEPDGMAGAIW